MQQTVQDIMVQHPPTLQFHTTLQEAADRMTEEGLRSLYIVDSEQRLLGILPDYEVLKAHLNQTDFRSPIEPLITRSLETVSPEMPLEEVFALFRIGWHQTLPVVRQGHLCGEISRVQVLKVLMQGEPHPQSHPHLPALTCGPRFLKRSSTVTRRDNRSPYVN